MKVYLDTCSLQRPLDSKTQIRIVLEAEAILGVIGLCENGEIELVSSEVLIFETNKNPKMVRREFGREVLAKAGVFVSLDDQIELCIWPRRKLRKPIIFVPVMIGF
jgi:hypothetical protein